MPLGTLVALGGGFVDGGDVGVGAAVGPTVDAAVARNEGRTVCAGPAQAATITPSSRIGIPGKRAILTRLAARIFADPQNGPQADR